MRNVVLFTALMLAPMGLANAADSPAEIGVNDYERAIDIGATQHGVIFADVDEMLSLIPVVDHSVFDDSAHSGPGLNNASFNHAGFDGGAIGRAPDIEGADLAYEHLVAHAVREHDRDEPLLFYTTGALAVSYLIYALYASDGAMIDAVGVGDFAVVKKWLSLIGDRFAVAPSPPVLITLTG